MKKYIIFVIFFCLLILAPSRVFAACSQTETANPANVCFYKTSYKTLSSSLTLPNQIQIFSGDGIISEFDETPDPTTGNKYYAGHMGSIWTPPYFSSHENYSISNPANQTKGFLTSLVFYSRTNHVGAWEAPSDPTTEAYWYPSKMEINKSYPNIGGGIQIQSIKTALPGRNFALKETITNTSSDPNELNLLFLTSIDTLARLEQWDSKQLGWAWGGKNSYTGPTSETVRVTYDPILKIAIFSNLTVTANPSYVAVGLDDQSKNNMDWELSDSITDLATNFKNVGTLRNQNLETTSPGAVSGFAAKLPALSHNQSITATLLISFGGSESEVKEKIQTLRGAGDVEMLADNNWNNKLSLFTTNYPVLTTSNTTLKKIYYNSALSYLLNRWDSYSSVGEASFYGASNAFFPWTIGTDYSLTMMDPVFWRNQLLNILSMDFGNCRAYQPIGHTDQTNNLDLCDTSYSYSPYSTVKMIYDYISLTGDMGILNQTISGKSVLAWMEALSKQYESENNSSTGLVDFGNDQNLYEFNLSGCSLGGNYTGYVVSPNSERYTAFVELADLFEKLGPDQAAKTQEYRNLAMSVKTGIQTLWNPTAGWFDSLNLYDSAGNKLSSTVKKTFYTVAVFHTLDAPELLNTNQTTSLFAKMSDFIDPTTLRFTSLPLSMKSQWCSRSDWHGPGLYSGEVGQMLTRLFQGGLKEKAADTFFSQAGKGYSFISQTPISFQGYRSDNEVFTAPGQTTAYLEGVSLSQSVITGIVGFKPTPLLLTISPRLPSSLSYPFSIQGLKTGGYSLDFSASSIKDILLKFTFSTQQSGYSFQYSPDGVGHTLTVNLNNLLPNKNYQVTVSPISGGQSVSVIKTSNAQGVLQDNITITEESTITFQEYALTPGDLNNDTHVNGTDFELFKPDFGKTGTLGFSKADINGNGKVDIFDYNTLVENFEK